MNQEPNCGQNYNEYLSRPEVLEEMRENLACLVQQESCDLDSVILSLKNACLPLHDQQAPQPIDMIRRRVEDMLESAQEQLRQRSTNLTSVAGLAIRMIDYINQQSASYYHSVQRNQLEVDRLQNTIDELMNRNTMIQSDVEIFREQLEAARNELEEITEEQAEIGDLQHSNVVECKIENLESELQRMRAQITFYKSSVFSRTALQGSSKDMMMHTKSLLALNQKNGKRCASKDEEEMSVSEKVEKNRQLQLENERLKNEIDGYRKSMLFFRRQGNKVEASDLPCPDILEGGSPRSKQLLRVRTSSKNFIQNSSCGSSGFGFSDFFKLFKAKREERLEKLMKEPEPGHQHPQVKLFHQPSQQSLQICAKEEDGSELLEKPRHLSSEWSRDSFNIFHQQAYEIPQLIFLTQQSEQNQNENESDKAGFFDAKPTSVSQNRQTQSSSKDNYNPNTIKITFNKSYESVGINTSRPNPPTQKPSLLQTLASNTFIHALKGFIVGNRLKRSRRSANSGTSTILI